MRRARSGFTILELIVSSSVMVFILTGAYLCLEAGLRSRRVVESRMDLAQGARVALNLIRADLESACRLSEDFEFVGMDRREGDVEADNLDFATHRWTPRAPGEGDFCEVSYYLDRNRETGEWSLYRRRDPTPDDEPFDGGSREELATGLRGLRFEYTEGIFWHDDWGDVTGSSRARASASIFARTSGLPDAVRVTLTFADPDPNAPKEDRKAPAGEKKAEPPPTLTYQTVIYLPLAARASRSTSSGTSGNESGSSGGSGEKPGGGSAGGPGGG